MTLSLRRYLWFFFNYCFVSVHAHVFSCARALYLWINIYLESVAQLRIEEDSCKEAEARVKELEKQVNLYSLSKLIFSFWNVSVFLSIRIVLPFWILSSIKLNDYLACIKERIISNVYLRGKKRVWVKGVTIFGNKRANTKVPYNLGWREYYILTSMVIINCMRCHNLLYFENMKSCYW